LKPGVTGKPSIVGAVLACLIALPAVAQDAGQATPPPAPVQSAPLGPLGGPGAPQVAPPLAPLGAPTIAPSVAPQATAPPSAPPAAASAPPPPTAYAPAPATPEQWLPRGTAEVQALDKVNARNAVLSVKVGDTAKFGSLTIAVQACVVTPPDQPQDAAAFLVITDSHAGQPGFSGWMVAAAPSASMLQSPVYDVRVTGCRA
jgi:hypothetical protein